MWFLKKWLKIPKGIIRSSKSKKDRQYNDQMKKDKRTNNDIQNTTQKTKDEPELTSGTPNELAVPALHVTPTWHNSSVVIVHG